MEPSLFLSMLGFLWVAAITPGPNNLLLTTSGANFGFMRSLWLMVGIMLGMQSILLLVAFGVGSLIPVYPSLHLILKILGSLYLLWLAWKVATAAYEKLETDVAPPQPVRLYQGWLLQFLNPKARLMALGRWPASARRAISTTGPLRRSRWAFWWSTSSPALSGWRSAP